ncbi:MAG: acetamidase/formamidase family protein [Candidatus Acidiferrales bacterium]
MPPIHAVRIDRKKPLVEESHTGHNRWHPDISPVLKVGPGDQVVLETRDALDGLITPDSTSAAIKQLDLEKAHPLTGPVFVTGAHPGDTLEVKILDITSESFGYTLLLPGSGLLKDYFPDPFLVKWEIQDDFATSVQLPGVRIRGNPFMGVIGVAPSRALLELSTAREGQLADLGMKVPLPSANSAVPGTRLVANEGIRTIPPRENGGNLDIKQLTKGTTLFLPVFTEGALLSAGDAHFAQGDSECCGTGVEIGATLTVQFNIRKGDGLASSKRGIEFECRDTSDFTNRPRRYHATVGISTTDEGRHEPGNLNLAARNATLYMIDFLVARYGFSREQAYILTSVAVDLRISEVVNFPNVVVSAFLPLDIFTS